MSDKSKLASFKFLFEITTSSCSHRQGQNLKLLTDLKTNKRWIFIIQCSNYWRGPAQTNHQISSGSNCFLLMMSKIPGTTYVLETPGPFWVRFITFIFTLYMCTIIWCPYTSSWLFPSKSKIFPFIVSSIFEISIGRLSPPTSCRENCTCLALQHFINKDSAMQRLQVSH